MKKLWARFWTWVKGPKFKPQVKFEDMPVRFYLWLPFVLSKTYKVTSAYAQLWVLAGKVTIDKILIKDEYLALGEGSYDIEVEGRGFYNIGVGKADKFVMGPAEQAFLLTGKTLNWQNRVSIRIENNEVLVCYYDGDVNFGWEKMEGCNFFNGCAELIKAGRS